MELKNLPNELHSPSGNTFMCLFLGLVFFLSIMKWKKKVELKSKVAEFTQKQAGFLLSALPHNKLFSTSEIPFNQKNSTINSQGDIIKAFIKISDTKPVSLLIL